MQNNIIKLFKYSFLKGNTKYFILLATLASVIGAYFELSSAENTLWLVISHAINEYSRILIAVMTAIFAFAAISLRSKEHEELFSTMPTSKFKQDMLVYLSSIVWLFLSFILAYGVVIVLALPKSTWGTPDIFFPILTLSIVSAYSTFGFLMGYIFPSKYVPPFLMISSFIFLSLAAFTTDDTFLKYISRITTVGLSLPSVFYGIDKPVLLELSFFYILTILICLCLIAIRARGAGNKAIILTLAGLLTLGSILVVRDLGDKEIVLNKGEYTNFEYICNKSNATEVCIHPAYNNTRDEVEPIFFKAAELFNGTPLYLDKVYQTDFYLENGKVIFAQSLYDESTHTLYFVNSYVGRQNEAPFAAGYTARDIILSILGDENKSMQSDAQIIIGYWFIQSLGYDIQSVPQLGDPLDANGIDSDLNFEQKVHPMVGSFARLSKQQQKEWLNRNIVDLKAGKLTIEDLP